MKDKYQVLAILLASIMVIVGCLWIGTYITQFQSVLIENGRWWYIVVVATLGVCVAVRKKK